MAKKDGGAMKKVLGVFFELDEKKEKQEPTPKEEAKEEVAEQPVEEKEAVIEVTTPVTPTVGEIDENMKQDLVNAIEEANIDGYDYFEFKEALFNMESVIPTEGERFKAAFAAVASMVRSDHLINTANHYIDVLNKKEESFNDYVLHMKDEKVKAKEDAAAVAEETIQQKQDQIIKLNQEIAELQEQKKTAQQEAITENAKIQQVELNFKTTCEAIKKKIAADIKKIETYLGSPKEEKVEVKDE